MTNTVLITGCSTGFGKLAAEKFSNEGWNVIATLRSPEKAPELANLANTMVTKLDVTDAASIKDAVSAGLKKFGTIDCLINNAGYGGRAFFEQASVDSIDAMFATNVFGVMNVMREVLPHMRKNKSGSVINVTSMAGMIGVPGNSVYSSSKWALEGLTEAMHLEYKQLGIKMHTVAPGAYVTTAFGANTDDFLDTGDAQIQAASKKMRENFERVVTSGDPQDPADVSDLMFKLATEGGPVHNPVGADAQMLAGLINGAADREAFVQTAEQLLLPQD